MRKPSSVGKGITGLVFAALVALSNVPEAQATIPENTGPQWVARYNGTGNYLDVAESLAVSPDGSTVFVTGYSPGLPYVVNGTHDYATVAYDSSTGVQRWAARYDGPASTDDDPRSIAVGSDGSTVFVTGSSLGSDGSNDYATVAYDALTGLQLWVARYTGAGNSDDRAYALAVANDGSKVFVTGASGPAYATVAYSASSGAQLWSRSDGGSGSASCTALDVFDAACTSLAVSPDGSKVFVTGSSTFAYDTADGTQLWVTPNNMLAYSLGVRPDGATVFVTGETYGPGDRDYATVAYAASSGTQLWATAYNGPGNGPDVARSLAVSTDGTKVVVTGSSTGSGSADDYATVAYAASSGTQLWAVRYNGPANADDFAESLAVSPDGSAVFVTGSSNTPETFDWDYATVAYAASDGAQLWSARYDHPLGDFWDFAEYIAVSPDGSQVFVTGGTSGLGVTSADFATIAYRTCIDGTDESGAVSGPVHDGVEPLAGPAAPLAHGANCDVVAENGM